MQAKRTRFAWLTLLAAGLTVSCVANLLLVRELRSEYARRVAAQVWPAGDKPGAQLDRPLRSGTPTVLLLGDSRISDWGTPKFPGWRVVNAGMRGMTTAQLALNTPAILERVQPFIVVIQIGINDLKLLGPEPRLYEDVVSTCVSNMHSVVQECRRHGARVVLTAVWPAGEVGLIRRIAWSPEIERGVTETNHRFEQAFSGRPDVQFTNIFAAMTHGFSKHDQNRLYRDTLHLNADAYAQLTAVLARVLETNQAGASTTSRILSTVPK